MSINQLDQFMQLLIHSKSTVVITGAGISTACGYPDLDKMNEITIKHTQNKQPLMQILTNRFAQQNPTDFYRLYRLTHFRPEVLPSASHQILTELEKRKLITGIITFNLDYLHTIAGAKRVIEYWGSINDNYCIAHHHRFDLNYIQDHAVPYCPIDNSLILPIFVMRNMVALKAAVTAGRQLIKQADLLIVMGTKLHHGLISNQAKLIVINDEPIKVPQAVTLFIQNKLDPVLEELLFRLKMKGW
ncbi:SIR2 family NAD-dependent protein deacylase [Liquorilactobacillus ghanensis]|uniref:SIR2 family NAD-dependent protein deacylase n=2 Tax=Liquorilactobacillus ghanensis TaxID=399370 RepID=UPI0039E77080